jgi:hypothetical protein
MTTVSEALSYREAHQQYIDTDKQYDQKYGSGLADTSQYRSPGKPTKNVTDHKHHTDHEQYAYDDDKCESHNINFYT